MEKLNSYYNNNSFLFDTHCHPQLIQGDESYIDYVDKLIAVSVEVDDAPIIKNFCQRYSHKAFYSLGIHPKSQGDLSDISHDYFLDKSFVAIGETGLDYYDNITLEEKKRQIDQFHSHLLYAIQYKKPVIIHSRYDVGDDIISILKQYPGIIGVLHSFTGTKNFAFKALELGLYISFSGIITFKNAQNIQDVASIIPQDQLLIETDSPYLTPVPFRGRKPNTPQNIIYIVEKLSQIYKLSQDSIRKITYRNGLNLFQIS